MTQENKKMYTLQEVADILHLTRRTIYSYVKDKKIKAVKVGAKHYRVSEEELNSYINNGIK